MDDVVDIVCEFGKPDRWANPPTRWITGNFKSFDGKPCGKLEQRFDANVVKRMQMNRTSNPIASERELAKALKVEQNDKDFRASLDRLCVAGIVWRKLNEWKKPEGYWKRLDDPPIKLTGIGENLKPYEGD